MGTKLQQIATSHASDFLNPRVCILRTETKLRKPSSTACVLQTRAKVQPGPTTYIPKYMQLVVYFSCCCSCIQSWCLFVFSSLVYCCAGCYDITRPFANINTVSQSVTSISFPILSWYVHSSICFSPSPLLSLLQTRCAILERTTAGNHIRDQAVK